MEKNEKKNELINFEEEIADLFNNGKFRLLCIYIKGMKNNNRIFKRVKKNDWIFCSWRSHYQCLLKGVPKEEIKKEILEGRSISLCFPRLQNLFISIVGGSVPIAVGTALSLKKLKNEKRHYGLLFYG